MDNQKNVESYVPDNEMTILQKDLTLLRTHFDKKTNEIKTSIEVLLKQYQKVFCKFYLLFCKR